MADDADDIDSEDDDWLDTRWAEPTSKMPGVHGNASRDLHASLPLNVLREENKSGSDSSILSRMQLNDNKAGMEGIDKEKINQIIYEASKGSRYYENERKKEEQVQKRIEEEKSRVDKITDVQLRQGLEAANKLLEQLEESRDLSHMIVHIDMDAYFAAVEMREDPSLRNKPMAVGGPSMLSTSNYLARRFGVRAAMPGFIGKKLCPELILVSGNYSMYKTVSNDIRAILAQYDPNFSPMSLDEAYLDVTDHVKTRRSWPDADRSYVLRKDDDPESKKCTCDLNETIRKYVVGRDATSATDLQKDVLVDSDTETSTAGRSTTRTAVTSVGEHLDGVGADRSRKDWTGSACPVCDREIPQYEVTVFGTTVEDAVTEMRKRIQQKTRLTASAGIAPNTMLAKVCSDRNKPDGQYRILPDRQQVMDFILDLPIRKISGIGKVSETMLRALGVVKCQDLYAQRALLYHLYSETAFHHFMRICLAIGSTTVERGGDRKSLSTERTFRELSHPTDLYKKCSDLCESLAEDLAQEQLKGKTVAIKIKTVKFEVKTRAHSLSQHTADYEDIHAAAQELLRVEIQAVQPQPLRLRLMGVKMSNLLPESLCETKQQDTITGLFQKMTAGGIVGNDDESKGKQKHATSKSLFKKSKSIPRASLSEQASSDCDSATNREASLPSSDCNSVTNRDASLPSSDCESMRQGMPCMTGHVTDHVTESAGEARPDAPVEDVSKEALKDHKDHQSENPQLKQFQCPVCHKDVSCKNLNYFNDHVDVCLFRQISQERELECSSDTLDDKKTEEVECAEITKTVPASSEPSKWKSKSDANAECSSFNFIQDSGFEIDSNDASSRTRNHLNKTLSLRDDSSKVETKIVQMVESEVPVPCPAAPVQCPGMEEAEFYACPVCNVEKIGCSLQDFNDHVDSCLSRRAIKQILDEQKTLQCPPGKRIHSSPNCSQQPSSKKRKSNNSSKMTTLHAFFKP